ncbi:hypothetical protein B0H14DRAFT_3508460 [Mycena olivaceomarginata]|nr:hypothetical protein B0H14DRAFT_3508460 [Mycena olivaceomarginata]
MAAMALWLHYGSATAFQMKDGTPSSFPRADHKGKEISDTTCRAVQPDSTVQAPSPGKTRTGFKISLPQRRETASRRRLMLHTHTTLRVSIDCQASGLKTACLLPKQDGAQDAAAVFFNSRCRSVMPVSALGDSRETIDDGPNSGAAAHPLFVPR